MVELRDEHGEVERDRDRDLYLFTYVAQCIGKAVNNTDIMDGRWRGRKDHSVQLI